MKNSAIQKIRRTAGSPIDLQTRREQLKIATTLGAFSLEMQALGLNFAMVMLDPDKQTESDMVMGFGGNVTQEVGSLMFETFLAMQKDTNATRTVLTVASPAAPDARVEKAVSAFCDDPGERSIN